MNPAASDSDYSPPPIIPAAAKTNRKRKLSTVVPSTGAGARFPRRKPDPSAPKITPPCSECGKKFWSMKALYGHMRCHPERKWRGANPPWLKTLKFTPSCTFTGATDDEQEAADALVMLSESETSDVCIEEEGGGGGGYMASYRNVKGCFRNESNDDNGSSGSLVGGFSDKDYPSVDLNLHISSGAATVSLPSKAPVSTLAYFCPGVSLDLKLGI